MHLITQPAHVLPCSNSTMKGNIGANRIPHTSLSLYLSLCGRFFKFLNLYTVCRTPWTGGQSVARPLPTHRTTQTQTSMPRVEFEPTIPVFEREKTFHALDRAVTLIGNTTHTRARAHVYIYIYIYTQFFNRVLVEGRFFSCPRRPYRFWGPLSVLAKGYRG
jgi:hypothetical protein